MDELDFVNAAQGAPDNTMIHMRLGSVPLLIMPYLSNSPGAQISLGKGILVCRREDLRALRNFSPTRWSITNPSRRTNRHRPRKLFRGEFRWTRLSSDELWDTVSFPIPPLAFLDHLSSWPRLTTEQPPRPQGATTPKAWQKILPKSR